MQDLLCDSFDSKGGLGEPCWTSFLSHADREGITSGPNKSGCVVFPCGPKDHFANTSFHLEMDL